MQLIESYNAAAMQPIDANDASVMPAAMQSTDVNDTSEIVSIIIMQQSIIATTIVSRYLQMIRPSRGYS